MDYAELHAKTKLYFRKKLEAAKARRNSMGPFSEKELEDIDAAIRLHEQENLHYWQLFGRDHAMQQLQTFCKGVGMDIPTTQSQAMVVLSEIKKAEFAVIQALKAYGLSMGHYDFSDASSGLLSDSKQVEPTVPKEKPQSPSEPTTSALLSDLVQERSAEAEMTESWSSKLKADYEIWTQLFIELLGDRPIPDYAKKDARAFKEALIALPANRNKIPETKGLTAKEAILAGKTHGLRTISSSTVNKALGRMQSTWSWADKQLDQTVADIFGPMKLRSTKTARQDRDPFTREQLMALFSSPLFTGCESERFRTKPGNANMSTTHWYWLPLLGLWTGARLNELCQLRLEDVAEDQGIPHLIIQEGDETQKVKTGKKRLVPLHPNLVELGFIEFLSAQRRQNQPRVFPELKLGTDGYYSEQSSKDFSNYLNTIGIKTARTSFHSLRHNFKDALRHSGVPSDINDILLGHTLPGMAARYGDGSAPLTLLYEEICKLNYADVLPDNIKIYPS